MQRDDLADLLIDSAALRLGTSWREIKRRVEAGDLVPVHRGSYASGPAVRGLRREQQHLLRVLAVTRAERTDNSVISHVSAAAVWGLPLYGGAPTAVHRTLRHSLEAHSGASVVRHRDSLAEVDVAEFDGIRCTSLERTVVDVARSTPLRTAVCAADAALRRVAWDDRARRYDVESAEIFKDGLRSRVAAMAGGRGVRQARHVIEFADGRAQLPGESVSRVLLHELGFTDIQLQVPISNGRGGYFYVDFGLEEADAWGEFDGMGKYLDPAMSGNRTPRDVLQIEKEREDWIRAKTVRPIARWSFDHLGSASALRRRLAVYSIRTPR
ncbi:hypothetical protein GCM10009775_20160 [Microbacterium aoyamense]|uniref:Transcriptional regulator, AbiEi antitoxin, Type IV TA system n=1 Tax=Microbacterium aoyamense TaxID=344166 RepID=A0ABP5B0J0_9MICO|nr:hypothetical protein [Microbacterium aoyamense]